METGNGFLPAVGTFGNADYTEEKQNVRNVVMSDTGEHFILDLTNRNVQYCSMIAETEEQKTILYNAMNNPEKRIADCINETISVKEIFIEVVFPVNEKTGESNACPRIVLIDADGIGYQAVSLGLYGAIRKAISAFGEPNTWSAPRQFKVKQITKGEKKLLTLDAVVVNSTAKAKNK